MKKLLLILLLAICNPVYAGAIILGLNLEFIEPRFNDEGFDGGFGIHAGYEFKDWHSWHFGGLFEYMNGWYSKDELDIEGEMLYDSMSLYATARPLDWPLLFKAGIVDAEYSVLQDEITREFRNVNDTGYGYGISLVFGNERFRVDLIDYKRVRIGNDSFDSYGISLGILFGAGGGFK